MEWVPRVLDDWNQERMDKAGAAGECVRGVVVVGAEGGTSRRKKFRPRAAIAEKGTLIDRG